MAKKPSEETTEGAPAEAAAKEKKPREPKPKAAPGEKGDKPEKGEKQDKAEKPAGDKAGKPKGRPDKAPGDKAEKKIAPDKPAGDQPAAPEKTDGAKPAAAPAAGADQPSKKKGKRPGVTPALGKKLRNLINNHRQKLGKEGTVPIKKAIALLKQMKRAKFDETVEVHMALGIDTTQSDQMVRGSVSLPHGIGKTVRVLVFCQGDNVAKAKDAGADHAGAQEFIEKIQKGSWLEFDVALATQDMMGQVSRLGKVLGPRGLMPTPKSGTVVPATGDIAAAVREFKAGKVEYRADKGGNVHAGVGKLSFDEDRLSANVTAFVEQIKSVKPAGVKGNYVKTVTLSATMSPGIRLSL